MSDNSGQESESGLLSYVSDEKVKKWQEKLANLYVIDDLKSKDELPEGIPESQIIKTSALKEDPEFIKDGFTEIRVVYPGQPVTRDLRFWRINLFVEENSQIKTVAFH